MKKHLFSFFALACAICANAAVIQVAPASSGDPLRHAIRDQAHAGDTLVLSTGEYVEAASIDLDKAGLVIRAGEGQMPVVKASSYMNFKATVTFEGIRFDGQNTAEYTAYSKENTAKNLTFKNCEFTGFTKYNITGSGSSAHMDSLVVEGCLFHDNAGPAVYMPASSLSVPGCNYFKMINSTVYNVGPATGCAAIDIRENTAGYTTNCVEVHIDHVTLYNYATAGNGGIMSYKSANVDVRNTIVANPAGEELYGTYVYGGTVANCLFNNVKHRTTSVQSNCLAGDPLFEDAANGNFALAAGSPAIGAGSDGTNLGDPRWNTPSTPGDDPEPSAQTTITVDGDAADWANVPMLTEPGAADVVKMVVPQDGLTLPAGSAYCVMVASQNETAVANYPVIYTDADKNNATGTAPWICPAMGYEYEMATWSTGSLSAASASGDVHEMCIMQAAFSDAAFTGSFYGYLTFNWGALYIPTDPTTDSWKWSADARHPFNVAPYTFADLNGEHTAAAAYSSHYALTIKADGTYDFNVSGGAQDTAFWISWPVELTQPAEYAVSANVTSTDNASCDLFLVDMATNQVVATHASENVWAPTGEATFGTWDLSGIPAGKYMLKMKNHVAWSHMVLSGVSLEKQTATSLEETITEEKAQKIFVNGQVVLIRDGVQYSILGIRL